MAWPNSPDASNHEGSARQTIEWPFLIAVVPIVKGAHVEDGETRTPGLSIRWRTRQVPVEA